MAEQIQRQAYTLERLGNEWNADTKQKVEANFDRLNALLRNVAPSGFATVVQPTDKTTAVTLNSPSGQIDTAATLLAADAAATFTMFNSFIGAHDILCLGQNAPSVPEAHTVSAMCFDGYAEITITNRSTVNRAQVVTIAFAVVAGG